MPWKDKAKQQAACREIKAWYKAYGICPNCGRAWAEPGRVYCAACMRKDKLKPSRQTEGYNREKCRARRERLIEKGLCARCGKRPPEPGHRACAKCLAAQRDSNRKAYIIRRIEREAAKARANNGTRNNST